MLNVKCGRPTKINRLLDSIIRFLRHEIHARNVWDLMELSLVRAMAVINRLLSFLTHHRSIHKSLLHPMNIKLVSKTCKRITNFAFLHRKRAQVRREKEVTASSAGLRSCSPGSSADSGHKTAADCYPCADNFTNAMMKTKNIRPKCIQIVFLKKSCTCMLPWGVGMFGMNWFIMEGSIWPIMDGSI